MADQMDWYYESDKISDAFDVSGKKDIQICSHFPFNFVINNSTNKGIAIIWGKIRMRWGDVIPADTTEWKSYLAAQYAAGTPVQVAYKLTTPAPFTATEGDPILAISGVNTILTDADNVTVKGRADTLHTINILTDRVAALETAAADA